MSTAGSPILTADPSLAYVTSENSIRDAPTEQPQIQASSSSNAPELDESLASAVSEQSMARTEQSNVEDAEPEKAGVLEVAEPTAARLEGELDQGKADLSSAPSPAPKNGVFRRLARKMSLQKVSSPKEPRHSVSSNTAVEDSGTKDQAIVEDVIEVAAAAEVPEPEAVISTDVTDAEAADVVDVPLTPSKPKSGPFKQLKERLKGRRRDSAGFTPATSLASIPASVSAIPDATATDAEPSQPPTQYESADLAHQIRKLVAELPCPDPDTPFPKPPTRSELKPIKYDKTSGRPITPPTAIFTTDTVLIKKLRDPVIMNGKEDNEPSVFDVLQQLGPANAVSSDPSEGKRSQDSNESDSSPSLDRPIVLQDSSVMMYAPLEPTEDDKVELAQFKYVPLSEFSDHEVATKSGTVHGPTAAWKLPWPFHKGKPSNVPATSPPSEVVKVWLPSATKLSIQCLWWGYRLYLPPPVLSILSDESIEASKRAALITTALTWLFNNLPLAMFPAPMQPALLLLQKIVPFVGYIGSFVSWSFGQVKSYDLGYGVILSATWVLPMALIPGTWQKYDFPEVTSPGQGTGAGNGTGTDGKPSIVPTPTPSTGVGTGTGTPVATQPSTTPIATQPSTTPITTQPSTTPVATQPSVTPVNPPSLPSGDISIQPVAASTIDPSVVPNSGKDDAELDIVPSAEDEIQVSGDSVVGTQPDTTVEAETGDADAVTKEEGESEQKQQPTGNEVVGGRIETDDKVGELNGTGIDAGNKGEKTGKSEKRRSRGIVGGLFNYFLGSR